MSLKYVYLIENLFLCSVYVCIYSPQVAQMVKNLPAGIQETWVQSLGWEDPLEKGMAPTPVFLPGEFHGQRSLGGCSGVANTHFLLWDV